MATAGESRGSSFKSGSRPARRPLVVFALARCTSPLWASLPFVAVGVLLAEALVWFGRFVAAYLGPEVIALVARHVNRFRVAEKGATEKCRLGGLGQGVVSNARTAATGVDSRRLLRRVWPAPRTPDGDRRCVGHAGRLPVRLFRLLSREPHHHRLVGPPALAYVLILLMLLTWGLSAASFFLDRWRVSAALVIASIPFVLFFVHDLDHYYVLPEASGQIVPAADVQKLARVAEPEERREIRRAFTERLRDFKTRHPDREPVVVAVAASGGGITASLWTATVLEGLQQDFGPAFADSLHFISSVSGGSVGTMHYVDGFRDGAPPHPAPRSPVQPGQSVRRRLGDGVSRLLARLLTAPSPPLGD